MENDWTKVLGFPGYRVYQQEIDEEHQQLDRKSTRLNSSHLVISYAVFCLKKKVLRTMRRNSPDCLSKSDRAAMPHGLFPCSTSQSTPFSCLCCFFFF